MFLLLKMVKLQLANKYDIRISDHFFKLKRIFLLPCDIWGELDFERFKMPSACMAGELSPG